jgi:hypothetical protein
VFNADKPYQSGLTLASKTFQVLSSRVDWWPLPKILDNPEKGCQVEKL